MADLTDIGSRLRLISDELGDAAIERLRNALEDGDMDAATEEKRITRARRAVDKAAALLDPTSPLD